MSYGRIMSFASVPLAAVPAGGYISIVKVVLLLVVLLVWAYDSAQVLADRSGSRVEPEVGAERVTPRGRAEQGMARRG